MQNVVDSKESYKMGKEYKKKYNKRQIVTFHLLQKLFLEADKKCGEICRENGIDENSLLVFGKRYRNDTTFCLANGWELDYKMERSYNSVVIGHDEKNFNEPIFTHIPLIERSIRVFPDHRRCANPLNPLTAIVEITVYDKGKGLELDDFNTFINPRLALIAKMNKNQIEALTPELFYQSEVDDRYALLNWLTYGHRVITGSPVEVELLKELIQLLEDIRLVKSCQFMAYKNRVGGLNFQTEELPLPFQSTNYKLKKRREKPYFEKKT